MPMQTRQRRYIWLSGLFLLATTIGPVGAQEASLQPEMALARAVMCESIQEYAPVNPAVVFSIALGRISCFTEFDPVPRQTTIQHKWYRNGRLITVKQLTIKPPRWSSFTSVQLRDADIGPWRVEVTDENDTIMRTLRFSITD